MTKMREVNHEKICPVCGYKYCDHSYDGNIYDNDNHTHSNYTTASTGYTSYTKDYDDNSKYASSDTYRTTVTTSSAKTTAPASSASRNAKAKQGAKKFTKIYVRLIILMVIIQLIRALFAQTDLLNWLRSEFLGEDTNSSYYEEEVYSDSEYAIPLMNTSSKGQLMNDFFSAVFGTDLSSASQDQLDSVVALQIYSGNAEGCTIINYELEDGTNDYLEFASYLNPKDLSYFRELEYLCIPSVHLETGDLGLMPKLYYISSANSPEELADILSNPSNISTMEIYLCNSTNSLRGLESFENLSSFFANGAGLTDIDSLTMPKSLQYVGLVCGSVTNFSCLEELTDLAQLQLFGNVTDIRFVENMPELTYLYLNSCSVKDITPIVSCEKLYLFGIEEDPYLYNCDALAALQDLMYVYLSNTGISDLSFARNLTYLNSLYIDNTGVKDLSPLANLQNLDYIYCEGCDIQNTGSIREDIIYR